MYTQERVSLGTSVCVKITRLTASAVRVPASACLRSVRVGMTFPHSCHFTESLKQKLKGGVVNTETLSAEQPVCIILCGKQPRQTGDFQSHSSFGWPWCVRKQTISLPLPTAISLPLILLSLCLSLSWAHTHRNTPTHIFDLIHFWFCTDFHFMTLKTNLSPRRYMPPLTLTWIPLWTPKSFKERVTKI